MTEKFAFTTKEREETWVLIDMLRQKTADFLAKEDADRLIDFIKKASDEGLPVRDAFGMNPVLLDLQTTLIAIEEIGLKRDATIAILLDEFAINGIITLEEIKAQWGEGVEKIINGIMRIRSLYAKNPVIESENFRNLLLSFAEDMQVILVMIASRVNLMRRLSSLDDSQERRQVAEEASYLYAPLAHKLGLYKLKSELEDLSLKFLEHDAYYHIKEKLSETKASRDKYMQDFMVPIRQKLEEQGLKFHMKGRTKSIHSIWQKMKKQRCPFEGVYDLFAIRIILDSQPEREKMECWQVYSIITDMYQPNPKRLRDWLSVPKSNGYESLHITVLGPEEKWVEVQIRTERMDDIAEHGLAAHWRYKGIKADKGGMEEWLASVRAAMEAGNNLEVMDQFKTTLSENEIYVFTPKGELYKFPAGATVLDFAYHIHSKVGNGCTGGKINGRVVSMREELHSGDQVQVVTSAQQKPKRDWLNIVKTTRAKSKIRLALKETLNREIGIIKETIERRLKNRKLDFDEIIIQQLVKKMGIKEVADFYKQVSDGNIDIQTVIEMYQELKSPTPQTSNSEEQKKSAAEFVLKTDSRTGVNTHGKTEGKSDVLVIDRNQKGLDYSLANCCRPIYGDEVFGFVTVSGGIKIHRCDCPNATELRKRFGYRIVEAKWSGKGASQYSITLRIIGNDDIGIVSNITNIISKEENIMMRSINIDSNDGLFSGNLVVNINDTSRLEQLIRKLKTVKGVRQVSRI